MQVATTIDGDNGMIVKRLSVPIGLEELMESLTKQVLLKKPKDIYSFASDHFAHLLTIRDTTVTDSSNQKETNGLHSGGKSSIKIKSATVATKFNKLPTPIIFTNCKTIRQTTPNNSKPTTRKSVNISPRSLDRGRNVVSSSSDTSQKNDLTRQARAGRARWKKRDVNAKDQKPPISLPPSHRIRDVKKSRSASTENTKTIDSGRKLRKTTSEPDDGSVKERKRPPTNRRIVSSDRSSKPDSKSSSISKNSSGDDDSISVKGSSISLSNKAASKKSRSPLKKAAIVAPIPIAATAAAATLIKNEAQNKVNLINEKNLGKTEHITDTNKIQIKDDAGDSDFVDEDDRDGTAIENMEYVGGEVESKDVPVQGDSVSAPAEVPNDKSENNSDNIGKADVNEAEKTQILPAEANVKSSDSIPEGQQKADIPGSTNSKSANDDKLVSTEEDKEGKKDKLSQSDANEKASEGKTENLEDLGSISEIAEIAEDNKVSESIGGVDGEQQGRNNLHEETGPKLVEDDAIAKEEDQKEDTLNESNTEDMVSVANSEGTERANGAADNESKEDKINEINTNETEPEDKSEKNEKPTDNIDADNLQTDDLNKSTEESCIASEGLKEDKDNSLPKPGEVVKQKKEDETGTVTESETGPELVDLKNDAIEKHEEESANETGLVSSSNLMENEALASLKSDSETNDKLQSLCLEPDDKGKETADIIKDAEADVKATDKDSSKSKVISEDIGGANEGIINTGSNLRGAKDLDSDSILAEKNESNVMSEPDNKIEQKEDSGKDIEALSENANSSDMYKIGTEDKDSSKTASHDDIPVSNDEDEENLNSEKKGSNDKIQKDDTINDANVEITTDSVDSKGLNGNDDIVESASIKNDLNSKSEESKSPGSDEAKNIGDLSKLDYSVINHNSNASKVVSKPEDQQKVEEKPEAEKLDAENVTNEKLADALDDISKADNDKMVDSNDIKEPSKEIVDESKTESKVTDSLQPTNLSNEKSSEEKEPGNLEQKTDGDSLAEQNDIHNLTKSFLEIEQQNYVDDRVPSLDKSVAEAPHDGNRVDESAATTKNEISAEMPKASLSSEDIVKTADIKSELLDDNLAEVGDSKKAEIVDEGPLMLEDVSKYLRGSQDDGDSNLSKTLDVPNNEGSRAEDTISTAEDDTIDQVDSLPISEDSMVFGQTVKPEDPQVEALKSDTAQAQLPGDDAIKAATTIQAYLRGHLVRKELMSNPNTANDDKLYTVMEESEEATGDGGRVKRDLSSFTSEHADKQSVDGESPKPTNQEVLEDISSLPQQLAKDQGKVAFPDNKSEDGDEELSRPVTAIEVSTSDANSSNETNQDKPKANDQEDSNDKSDKAISVPAIGKNDESVLEEKDTAALTASNVDQLEQGNNLSPKKGESTDKGADAEINTSKIGEEYADISEHEKVEESHLSDNAVQVSGEKSSPVIVANEAVTKEVSLLGVDNADDSKSDIVSDKTFTINDDKEKPDISGPELQQGIKDRVKSEAAVELSSNLNAEVHSLDVDKGNEDPKSDVASDKTFTLNDDKDKTSADLPNKIADEEKSAGLPSTDLSTNNEDPKSDIASDKTFTINDGNDKLVSSREEPLDKAKSSEMNEAKAEAAERPGSALEEHHEDPKSDNASDKTFTINDVKDKLVSSSVDPVNELNSELAEVPSLNLDTNQEDPKSDVPSHKTSTIEDEKEKLALPGTDHHDAKSEVVGVVSSNLDKNNQDPKNEIKSDAAEISHLDLEKDQKDPKSDIASDKTFTIDDDTDKLASSSVVAHDEIANEVKSKDADVSKLDVDKSDESSNGEDTADKTFSIDDDRRKVASLSAEPQNIIENGVKSDSPVVASLDLGTSHEDSKSDMPSNKTSQNNDNKDNLSVTIVQVENKDEENSEISAPGNLKSDDKDKKDLMDVEPQGVIKRDSISKTDTTPSSTLTKNHESQKSDIPNITSSSNDAMDKLNLVNEEHLSIVKDESKSEETGSGSNTKSDNTSPSNNDKDNIDSKITELQQEVQDEDKSQADTTLGNQENNNLLNAAQIDPVNSFSDNTGANLPDSNDADTVESKIIPSSSNLAASTDRVQNGSPTNMAEEASSKELDNADPATASANSSLDNAISTALNNVGVAPGKLETTYLIGKEQDGSDNVDLTEYGDPNKMPESDSVHKAVDLSVNDTNSLEIKASSDLEDGNALESANATPTSTQVEDGNKIEDNVIKNIGVVPSDKDTVTGPGSTAQDGVDKIQKQAKTNTGGKSTEDLELPNNLSDEGNNVSIADLNSEETTNNKEATEKSDNLVETGEKARPNEPDLDDNNVAANINADETANNTEAKSDDVDESAEKAQPIESNLLDNKVPAKLNAEETANSTEAKSDDVDETGENAQQNTPDLLSNNDSIVDLKEPLNEEHKKKTSSDESANTTASSAKNVKIVVAGEEALSNTTDILDSTEDANEVVKANNNTDDSKASSDAASSKEESSKDGAVQTSEVSEIKGKYAENDDLSNNDANKTTSGSKSSTDQGASDEPTEKDLEGVATVDVPIATNESTKVSEDVKFTKNDMSKNEMESFDNISVVADGQTQGNSEDPQRQVDVLNGNFKETDDKANKSNLKENTASDTDLPPASEDQTDGKEQDQTGTSNEANKTEEKGMPKVESEDKTAKESGIVENSKDSEVSTNNFSVVDTNVLTPKDSDGHLEQILDSLENKDGNNAHSTHVQDVDITPVDIQSSIEASHKESLTANVGEIGDKDIDSAKENVKHLPSDSAASVQALIKDSNIDSHEQKDTPVGTISVAAPPPQEEDSEANKIKAEENTSVITSETRSKSGLNRNNEETSNKSEDGANKTMNSENSIPENKENESDNSNVNTDTKKGESTDKVSEPTTLDNSSDLKNEAETNQDSLTSEHDTKDILDQIKNDLNHMKNLIEEKDDLDGITTPEFEYPHKADENVSHFNQLGRLISTGSTTSLDSAATVVVTEDLNKLKPTDVDGKSQIHDEIIELNRDDLQSANAKNGNGSRLSKEGSKVDVTSQNYSEASLEDVKNAINSQPDAAPVIAENSDISKGSSYSEQMDSLKEKTGSNASNEAILDATAASDGGTVEQDEEKTPGVVVDINSKTNIDAADDKANKHESAISSEAVQPSLGEFIRSLSRSPPNSRNDDKSKIQQLFPSEPESVNAEGTSPILAQENKKPEPFYLHEPGKSKASESLSSSPVTTHGPSMGLMHSGEFHDSVPLNFSNDVHVIIQDQRSPSVTPTFTGLQHSGEFHDGLIAHGSVPAGAETVTVAHASDRDGSTLPQAVGDATDAVESMPAMDGKRNNATIVEKNSESEAATKIQASFRGYQVRKQLKTKNGGDITSPRRSARRKSSGKIMDSNKAPPKREKVDLEERSATKIQAGIRGFLVRRRHQKTKPSDSP